MAPTCYLSFITIVHLRSLCRGWLRGLFSFSAWRSSFSSTLAKQPPAKETIAPLVIFICLINKTIAFNSSTVLLCSMTIVICISFSFLFAGYALKKKLRYYLGIFPKWRTPKPPPFWEPLIRKKFIVYVDGMDGLAGRMKISVSIYSKIPALRS